MMDPKVLILGQAFNTYTGGGITLSSLFAGWDSERIAVASIGHGLRDADFKICHKYYQLGNEEQRWIFPFQVLQKKFPSGILNFHNEKTEHRGKKNGIRSFLVNKIAYPALKYCGVFEHLSTITISRKFKFWLEEFGPELLYVQVSDREGLLFAARMIEFLKIPMVVHIMDDWIANVGAEGIFKKHWRRKIEKEFKSFLTQASLLLSISDDMAIEYQKRYGLKFRTFHNSIDVSFWKSNQKRSYELNLKPIILYAGRIGLGIDSSLKTIAKSVDLVNLKIGADMQFVIQSKENAKWLSSYKCIVHRPFTAYNDLPRTFSQADFLIIPYDFFKRSHDFVKYSMPTKFPEYMISGTPIIIFAPYQTAVVTYAKRHELAEIVNSNSASDLSNTIIELMQNKHRRIKIGTHAKAVAEGKHNAINIRSELKILLIRLMSINRSSNEL